ncbi:MAG: nuclear transport factor 2 family protein [Chloroflexi bacterium]|nr:nuclear transport factor 2 family protein [Chloroflexota bacterium]
MSQASVADMYERYMEAANKRDYEAVAQFLTDDYVEEYPQSGERVRGFANVQAILENYPGGGVKPGNLYMGTARLVGEGDRWVMTPTFAVLRVTGAGDFHTAVVRARYPDETDWYIISIIELRDMKIRKSTVFFAPVYEAPEWRAQWVEPMEKPEARPPTESRARRW